MMLSTLAAHVGARLLGDDVPVVGIDTVRRAGPGYVGALMYPADTRYAIKTQSSALLTSTSFAAEQAHRLPCAVLVVDEVWPAATAIKALFLPVRPAGDAPLIHRLAAVEANAILGEGVAIEAFAVVGEANIGAHCRIGAHAVIEDGVRLGARCVVGAGSKVLWGSTIGDRVIVGPGAVIGSRAFMHFDTAPKASACRIPIGGVCIGDDVCVGANICIDSGTLGTTRIGHRVKIDNLVQIGHDVIVGDDSVVVAQSGIAGFADIGSDVQIMGQSGVAPFVAVGSGAQIGPKTGILQDMESGERLIGFPAISPWRFLRRLVKA